MTRSREQGPGFRSREDVSSAAGCEARTRAACGFQVVFREVGEEEKARNVIVVVKDCDGRGIRWGPVPLGFGGIRSLHPAGPRLASTERKTKRGFIRGTKGWHSRYASTNLPLSMVAWTWSFEIALKIYLNRWDMSQGNKGLVITDKQIQSVCTKAVGTGSSLGGLRRQDTGHT
jgi:predicted nucleic acid-binding Zn ribbon protein